MKELIPQQLLDEAILFALNEVYLAELEAATPKKTRVTSEKWKIRKKGLLQYQVYNDATTGEYSIVELLEYGTRPHLIRPKRKKALHWQKGAKDFFAKLVHHPGFAGRFFVKRTLERKDLQQRFEKFLFYYLKQRLK